MIIILINIKSSFSWFLYKLWFCFRYGYVTNTRIKLVLVTSSTSPSGSNIRDAEVRTALRRLHALYADAICNPFHLPGDQITSLYVMIIKLFIFCVYQYRNLIILLRYFPENSTSKSRTSWWTTFENFYSHINHYLFKDRSIPILW